MKYLGKKSIANGLRHFFNLSWYGLILFMFIWLGLLCFAVFKPDFFLSFGRLSLKLASFSIDFEATPPKQVVLCSMSCIFGLVLIVWLILGELRKVFLNLVQERIFITENALRIRKIGFLMIGVTLLEAVIYLPIINWIQTLNLSGISLRATFDLNLESLAAGLIVLVVSEIFLYGVSLQETNDLTI